MHYEMLKGDMLVMEKKKQPNVEELSKRLSAFDLFTIGFGAIIGVGWIIVIGDWVNLGGGPLATTLAFVVGALCLYPIARVFGALNVALPKAGGPFYYTLKAFGKRAAFVTGWFLMLAYVMMCPWEVIAIGQLAQTLFPPLATVPLYSIQGEMIYLPTLLLCLVIAGVVICLNIVGIDKVARVQKVLVFVLMGISVIIIITAVFCGNISNIKPLVTKTPKNPQGRFINGFLAVLAMQPFFFSGFDTIGQEIEEVSADSDKCRVGSVSGIAVCSSGLFYALIIPAVCMVMPWADMLTLQLPAAEVFSVGLGLNVLKVIVIIGAFCGLLTTLNSFYVASARLMMSMGRESLLPSAMKKVHPKYHTPLFPNICIGILCLAGCFLSKGLLMPIINVCSFGYILAWLMVSISAFKLRKDTELVFPYSLSRITITVAIILASVMLLLLIIPGSPGALVWPLEICLVGIWLILGVGFLIAIEKRSHS